MNREDTLLVLGAVEESPEGATYETITSHIEIPLGYLSQILSECVVRGLIDGEQRSTSWGILYIYHLTDEGRIYLSQNEEGDGE